MTLRTRRTLQALLDQLEDIAAANNWPSIAFRLMAIKRHLGLRYWRK